jgi:SAM-dependent methyltransferase
VPDTVRRVLKGPYMLFSSLLFDPRDVALRWAGVPYFVKNLYAYRARNQSDAMRPRVRDWWYHSHDRFAKAGSTSSQYFHQDLWAARLLHRREVTEHVDVGSRLDGFVAHMLTFATVTYVDIRPLPEPIENLRFERGNVTALPFADRSVDSLSCLHVIEHIGLGRYGDPIDPEGHVHAARELARVLAPGGVLLIGTPVGRERLCFDAHRVFDPETILSLFSDLRLTEFAYIDDRSILHPDTSPAQARSCEYGCGLYAFTRDPEPTNTVQ